MRTAPGHLMILTDRARSLLDRLAARVEWLAAPLDWFRSHPALLGWLFGLSILLFLGSLVAVPMIVARMRRDYFVSRRPGIESWGGRHRVLRVALLVMKNLVGLVLVLAGLAMLVLPGQGVIAILIGITLLNFPGKRRLELAIARQRHVRAAIDWIRKRAGRPPLVFPEEE